MEPYFFHLQTAEFWRDREGSELTDIGAAKRHAVQYMVEHPHHHPDRFWSAETCEVRVADGNNRTLLVVSMTATFSPGVSSTS